MNKAESRLVDSFDDSADDAPSYLQDPSADTDYNIYYCAGDPSLAETALFEQQRDGVDAHSLAVDPLFVDPGNDDFRFKRGSPARQLGIVPIDIFRIGLRRR